MYNQTLIAKYLEIMRIQDKTINELKNSRKELLDNIEGLKRKNRMYKENILYWKAEHDKLQKCLIGMKFKCVSVYEKNALSIYKKNQGN